jgi:hypothetical protein
LPVPGGTITIVAPVHGPALTHREALPEGWSDELDVSTVLAGQGIDPSSRGARLPALHDAATHALREGLDLLSPAVASKLVAVERSSLGEVVLVGGHVISGHAAGRRLSGALHVMLVVCTVGDGADRRAAALMSEDPAVALAFDGLATAAVNALASAVCRDLRALAARAGQRTSSPLSPGQGEWDLAEGQHAVFAHVRPERIGVRLSESGQMQPCKSLSFAVAIGPTVDDRAPGGCAGCSAQPGCRYRNMRRDAETFVATEREDRRSKERVR